MPYKITSQELIPHQKARVLAIATTATIEKGSVTLEEITSLITISKADLITICDELTAEGKFERA